MSDQALRFRIAGLRAMFSRGRIIYSRSLVKEGG